MALALSSATLALGCPAQEVEKAGPLKDRVLYSSAIILCARKGTLGLKGQVRLPGHRGGYWHLLGR